MRALALAPPTTTQTGSLSRQPWPAAPLDLATAVRQVADEVIRRRTERSVRWESGLLNAAQEVLDEERRRPGFPGALAAELAQNPQRLAEFLRLVRAHASLLYPLSLLLYAPGVEELTIYEHDSFVVSRGGECIEFGAHEAFPDDHALETWFRDQLMTVTGVRGDSSFTVESPSADVTIGPFRFTLFKDPILGGRSLVGASVRVLNLPDWTLDDLVELGTMRACHARLLEAVILGRVNTLFVGATNSGKTTLLRVLARVVPEWQRIVTLEDANELRLRDDGLHRLTQALITVPSPLGSQGDLFGLGYLGRKSLRMRPDRIWMGEMRAGPDALVVARAMTTGHEGCIATIHANSAQDGLDAMEGLIMENDNFSAEVARRLVLRAVELVVYIGYDGSGPRRIEEILAVHRGGNHDVLYAVNEHGALERQRRSLAQLSDDRLRSKLRRGGFPEELPE
jgi:Flp pilus assembly CpaF family ATPase